MRLNSLILSLSLLALTGTVQASLITIEPDDYAHGTVIGPTADASLSFMSHRQGDEFFTFQAAIAAIEPSCTLYATCAAPTGTHVLSDGSLSNGQLQPGATFNLGRFFFVVPPEGATIAQQQTFTGLRVDFAEPTNFFSADFFNRSSDIPAILAFAQDGTLLSRTSSGLTEERRTLGPGCTVDCTRFALTVTTLRDAADIAFVVVGSTDSATGVDAVRFQVPEPATLALFGLGLLAMLRTKRSKNGAA
jgi:hypothetical protein